MLKQLFSYFSQGEDLRAKLNQTKRVRVRGVFFTIKKIDMLNYLEGARVLHEIFSVYKTKEEKRVDSEAITNIKKARDYMRDVLMSGVVKPQIVRKQEDNPDAVTVDELLNDWLLAQELVAEILNFTYGKKK